MRFTDEEIERAKDKSIKIILGLQNFGKIRCPFHQERTPSFVLYPSGKAYCFGCGIYCSDSIDFLIKQGITFPEAVKYLIS